MASRPKVTRDAVLFLGGLLGVAHETLANGGDRIALLTLFAGMMGLPAFLGLDERRSKDKSNGKAAGGQP